MGRKWNKRKKSDGKTNKVQKPKRERPETGYVQVKKESKNFETFYKAQNLVPEEEWPAFITSLQTSLPAAFRVTGNSTQAAALLRVLKEDYFKPLENLVIPQPQAADTAAPRPEGGGEVAPASSSNGVEEEEIKPLKPLCLPWYPNGLAYQLNLSRHDIRRCEAYWRLHQFLVTETEIGAISRQEAVSMIPPLLLGVQPHHKVLDMCAAPGSKTSQLIEHLHSSSDALRGAIPPGVVVANDADNRRCYLLTHQAKRMQSPSIMITNHDACFMPNMFYTGPDGSSQRMRFDRILCDVPCSGDGTLRKNCDVWAKWNPVNAANLHGLQLRIARRGLELLAVGGRLVYSTCSFSPLENEAVLQRLLLEAAGSVQLVDVKGQLPGLKYREGLNTWVVLTKDMEVIPSPEDIPTKWTNVFHKHLFPVSQDMHLDRCLRLLPHHQDTGGFFVAVLEKVALLPGEKSPTPLTADAPHPTPTEAKHTQRIKEPPKKRRRQGYKEEPYYYLSDACGTWEEEQKLLASEHKLAATETKPETTNSTTVATENQQPINSTTTTAGEQTSKSLSTDSVCIVAEQTTAKTSNDICTETKIDATNVIAEIVSGVDATISAANIKCTTTNSSDATTGNTNGDDSNGNNDGSDAGSVNNPTNPFTPLADPDEEDVRIWSSISTFYNLRKDVPESSYRNFLTRSKEGRRRNLYFTNSLVRDLIDHNQDRMKIINTGVKVLVRSDNKGTDCGFRLCQEGSHSLLPLLGARRLLVARADMLLLLRDHQENAPPPEITIMSQPLRHQCESVGTGSVVFTYHGDPKLSDEEQHTAIDADIITIELVGWKGKSSLRGYIARSDRVHYLRLLRADVSDYHVNKFTLVRKREKDWNETKEKEKEKEEGDGIDGETVESNGVLTREIDNDKNECPDQKRSKTEVNMEICEDSTKGCDVLIKSVPVADETMPTHESEKCLNNENSEITS